MGPRFKGYTKPTRAQLARQKRTAMVERMLLDGLNQNQIAKYMGVSRQAVNQLIHRPKLNARQTLGYAVKKDFITRPLQCETCQVTCVVEAHHDDYTQPLKVLWLCTKCHLLKDNKGTKPKQ